MPGMKNYQLIRKSNNQKEKIQKRYMTMSCHDAFELYRNENLDNHVGKSLFHSYRPPFVLLSSKTPHDVCSCQYHQDMEMLQEAISKFYVDNTINSMKILLDSLVCSSEFFLVCRVNATRASYFL